MRRPLLLLASLLPMGLAPAPLPRDRPDAEKLQGAWERTRLYNGTLLIPERPGEVVLVIAGDLASFARGGAVQTRWTMTLDTRQSPRQYEWKGLGDSKGSTLRGVYRLEGDTLTMCYAGGGARAKSFDKAQLGVCLVVFKRKKR